MHLATWILALLWHLIFYVWKTNTTLFKSPEKYFFTPNIFSDIKCLLYSHYILSSFFLEFVVKIVEHVFVSNLDSEKAKNGTQNMN